MKKLMPVVLLCVMVMMLFISWSTVLNFDKDKLEEYEQHIQSGDKLKEKEVYVDAVSEYEAALRLRPDNYELAMEIVHLYEKLDEMDSYVTACNRAISADSTKLEPYILLADYYMEKSNNSKAYSILQSANEVIKDNEEIKNRIITLKKDYSEITIADSNVGDLYYYDGLNSYYSMVKRDGKCGLLSTSASMYLECEYDDIGLMVDNLMPVQRDGEYFFVNEDMYRKLVPDVTVEYFGSFGDGYAPTKYNGYYGYVNEKLLQCNIGEENKIQDSGTKITYNFNLDYAGSFANGVAAVRKENKWALVSSSLEYITDYEFDDILMDEYGYCSRYGRIFAKKADGYYLYDCEGTKISGPYEDAKLFVSKEPAAVKQNGKWGFISQNGEMVIKPNYEDAKSFSLGYAPYCESGKWGCIGENGELIIEPTFDELYSFAGNGYALSKSENTYKYIVIHIYD